MEAYCVKCRAKREISNATQVTLKNGRPATQGTCPTCGTKVLLIGKGLTRKFNLVQVLGKPAAEYSSVGLLACSLLEVGLVEERPNPLVVC